MSFHGKHFSFDDLSVQPKPVQKPHPPIVIANNLFVFNLKQSVIDKALKRVATFSDGCMTAVCTTSELETSMHKVRQWAKDAGRNANEMVSTTKLL